MINAFKAELRKVFSLRSTYYILAASFALELLFAFYATGWRAAPEELSNPDFLTMQALAGVSLLMFFASLVGILLVTHEYRYNTINYSLTASRSRLKVFIAKTLVVSLFAIVFCFVFGLLSPLLTLLAVELRHLPLVHQNIDFWGVAWRALFAGWGFSMLGFILALIIRSQVGALVAIFLAPGALESILGLLLKKNQIYLPFTANSMLLGVREDMLAMSYGKAALVVGAYIVVGWLVAWVLFWRRDAN